MIGWKFLHFHTLFNTYALFLVLLRAEFDLGYFPTTLLKQLRQKRLRRKQRFVKENNDSSCTLLAYLLLLLGCLACVTWHVSFSSLHHIITYIYIMYLSNIFMCYRGLYKFRKFIRKITWNKLLFIRTNDRLTCIGRGKVAPPPLLQKNLLLMKKGQY